MASNRDRIFLTGFMGSGKSTVGVAVAPRLGWEFNDLDATVERLAGKTVEKIFEVHGEAVFRAWECEALRAVMPQSVCAVGGGALTYVQNMAWALDHGLVVFLQASPEILGHRLAADPKRRPLLEGPDGRCLAGGALMDRIIDLLEKREPTYQQAHITIKGGMSSPEEVATRIVAAYRSRNVLR